MKDYKAGDKIVVRLNKVSRGFSGKKILMLDPNSAFGVEPDNDVILGKLEDFVPEEKQNINKRIELLANKEPKTTEQQFMKLMEEVGEASQAYLSAKKVSGNGYKGLDIDDTKEELVDVLIVVKSLLTTIGANQKQVDELLQSKISKWESKQIR